MVAGPTDAAATRDLSPPKPFIFPFPFAFPLLSHLLCCPIGECSLFRECGADKGIGPGPTRGSINLSFYTPLTRPSTNREESCQTAISGRPVGMLIASSDSFESLQNNMANSPSSDDRKKRRSAAERRASHRRRSSQAIAESGQLSQLLNGLQRRGSGDSQKSRDSDQHEEERPMKAFSPILDEEQQTAMRDLPEEPPEPAIPAPGGEDEEYFDGANMTSMQQTSTPIHTRVDTSEAHQSLDFTPKHQRSVSDHLLHNVQSARRRQREISPSKPEEEKTQSPSFLVENSSNNLDEQNQKCVKHMFQTAGKRGITSKKAPLLSHIRKLQHENALENGSRLSHADSFRDGDWHSPERGGGGGEHESSASSSGTHSGAINKAPDRPPIPKNYAACNTSSSGLAQLVGRFSSHRQLSDTNLLRRTRQKEEEPERRSFKWKSLWGRRTGALEDITAKMEVHRRLNGQHQHLGTLMEDAETELGPMKRHSAAIDEMLKEQNLRMPQTPCCQLVRMRTCSSTEKETFEPERRPFSLIGTGREELVQYRLHAENLLRFEHYLRERTTKDKENGHERGEWDDSVEEEELPQRNPPRMTRPARVSPTSPPFSTQTLDRSSKQQRLQRTATSRNPAFANPMNVPRKKGPIKVGIQQRRRGGGALGLQARRKSIIHISVEEREQIVAAATMASSAEQPPNGKKQKRASVSTSSLKQLLNSGDRNRGKVAPKCVSGTKKGSMAAELESPRIEKEKKRETKANSMILGTIWSIRPRRKKDSGLRSLAGLWAGQEDGKAADTTGDSLLSRFSGFADSPSLADHGIQSPLSPMDAIPFNLTMEESADCSTTTTTVSLFHRPQLVQPKWEDLDLWAEQAPSWADKHADELPSLALAERKRQNVIYELMLTERHHCQVLVLLQQLYRGGLLRNRILSEDQLVKLIPDVLDQLLDFHLALLRQLQGRCAQSVVVVDGVADILLEHFQTAEQQCTTAIEAYTAFCMGREESNRQFSALMAQNQQFRKFMEVHASEYKERSLKDCMLLVAQRLTKYPVLVEQMVKLESRSDERREASQQAHAAVRAFAMRVDQQLSKHEMERQWTLLKKALDKAGTTKLIDPKCGQEFAAADLIWPVENPSERGLRRILLITRVFWRETMNGPDLELRLVLCDDLIVLLRPKNPANGSNFKSSALHFLRHNAHAGVLPLHSTLIRGENLRRKSLLLIVTAKARPDLFELAFPTCSELDQCVQAIKKAKAEAPNFVRLAGGKLFELGERPIEDWDVRRAELEFQTKVDQWRKGLDGILEKQLKAEEHLGQYFESRMEFMDQLRLQLKQMPRRGKASRADEEEAKQLRQHLSTKFAELQRFRADSLVAMAERAQRVRDGDLLSLFDELHDLGQNSSGKAANLSSSDESPGRSDSSEERRKPRRVCTYHGTADDQRQRNSGGSSGSCSGIRRHTTVPRQNAPLTSSEEEERDEKSRLPLHIGPAQRRAATELIRENVRLRTGMNRLKAKSALQEMHLAALRAKGTRDTEEQQPQKELEMMAAELARREAELERREAELKAKESADRQQTTPERKPESKQNNGQKQQQSPRTEAAATNSGNNNASARISQTYCGAGPVPNNSRSAENSPAQMSAERRAVSQTELPRHLAVKTETKQKRK